MVTPLSQFLKFISPCVNSYLCERKLRFYEICQTLRGFVIFLSLTQYRFFFKRWLPYPGLYKITQAGIIPCGIYSGFNKDL